MPWSPHLDPASPLPLYEQVIEQVAMAITNGYLAPGDALPSIRALAAELRINPNTAARIVRELDALGLASTSRGVGSVVAKGARAAARPIVAAALDREIAGLVQASRLLGLSLDATLDSVRERWKELDDAD